MLESNLTVKEVKVTVSQSWSNSLQQSAQTMRPDDILALKMMKPMQLADSVIPSTLPGPITQEFKTFNLVFLRQSSQYVAED